MVSVYGQVARPGQYLVGADADLVEALLLAGGVTEGADVGHVRLVRNEGSRTVVNEVDLNGYFRTGDRRGNPMLKPGDTIEVGEAEGVGGLFRRLQPGLSIITAATTFFWAVDRLTQE